MRRHAVLLSCVCMLTGLGAAAAQAVHLPEPSANPLVAVDRSWARGDIRAVVRAGLLAPSLEEFRPEDPLTRGRLFLALARLGLPATLPADYDAEVSIRELDAKLVKAAGLLSSARRLRAVAARSGLKPTRQLGTETVARLLGFRFNHPQADDALELGSRDTASLAEAAFSLARLLELGDARVASVRGAVRTFGLPKLSPWQRQVLDRSLRLVGSPYVFAGTSEHRQSLWRDAGKGPAEFPGGFDCSGLVWRVYKLEAFERAPTLTSAIAGRTTFDMAAEIPAGRRIPFAEVRPGDVVFFGSAGRQSKPAEVGHTGIAVGGGWFVHSSSDGVTLEPLRGWYLDRFAWARRPLREAGITV
jgi:cell wall-associated NlpC family hydrolase